MPRPEQTATKEGATGGARDGGQGGVLDEQIPSHLPVTTAEPHGT